MIASQVTSLTESWLSTRFVKSYLRKCAQLCPDRVLRLLDDVSTSMKLQNAVSAVVYWRLNKLSVLSDLRRVWFVAQYNLSSITSTSCLTARSCDYWISEMVKIDSYLLDYFTAVAFLHVANRIAKRSLSDELMDVLATLLGQFVGKRRTLLPPAQQ